MSSQKNVLVYSTTLTLIFFSVFDLHAESRRPTAEQAVATIGYLAQKESKKLQLELLHEDLRLFIKKLVLLAKTKDAQACPDLIKLDQQLRDNFDTIEIKLLLDALTNAAYVIKNRASKICSEQELAQLNSELNRWCEFVTRLVNQTTTQEPQP